MKTLKYLSVILYVLCVIVQPVWAASNSDTEKPVKAASLQPITINIGVLISTIGSNGWRQTAIPDEWKGTIFDEIIELDDQSFKLKQAGMSSLQNNNTLKTKMANDLKSKLETIASRNNLVTLNVVIMGHSVLGGYLARTLASAPETFDLDNIVNRVTFGLVEVNFAAITFGTPHQGVGLSAVSVEPRSGFTNIAPTLNSFKTELQAGINEDVSWIGGLRYGFGDLFTIGALPALGSVKLYCVFDPAWCRGNIDEPIKDAQKVGSDYLDSAFLTAESIIGNTLSSITGQNVPTPLEAGFDYGLKELLKPDLGDGDQGVLVDQINALPDPDFYRNVFGAEKYPVPARVASELVMINVTVPLVNLDFDDEQDFNESFGETKKFARLQKDSWWTEHEYLYYFVCWRKVLGARRDCNAKKDRHKRRSRNWGRTERAMANIDGTWGTLINANKYEQRTGYRQIYDPSICEGGGGQIPGFFKYATVENINMLFDEGDDYCDPYRYESYNYVATIPLKNDGITTPNHSTWNKNDNVYSESSNNFYYDDSGDGGYNHLEIRRVKRLYTQGANKKGDLALPIEETRIWLLTDVLK
tara:strand:- start:858 stop:2615 length:1758 start_codon:yes stop_codon:yes gene_type:complete